MQREGESTQKAAEAGHNELTVKQECYASAIGQETDGEGGARGKGTKAKEQQEHDHDAGDHKVVRYKRVFVLDAAGRADRS